MKSIFAIAILLASISAFAGRPTPLGDSMAQIRTVSEQLGLGTKILNIRLDNESPLHYVIEFRNYGETFCRAQGYNLVLISRDSQTAAPTYEATLDDLKRICTQ